MKKKPRYLSGNGGISYSKSTGNQTQRTSPYITNHDFHHKMAAYNFIIHRMVNATQEEEQSSNRTTSSSSKKNEYNRDIIVNGFKKSYVRLQGNNFPHSSKKKTQKMGNIDLLRLDA